LRVKKAETQIAIQPLCFTAAARQESARPREYFFD